MSELIRPSVQSAYLAADLKKLKALMAAISTETPLPDSPTALEQLKAEAESLERHLQQLTSEIARIKADPPFTLEAQLLSETWIETRRAEIDTECAALTNLRIQLEAHVTVLAAHPTNGQVTGLN